MNCYWFNPENDLALAAGIANYTAPQAAMRLAQAGALLPLWYAGKGDCVLCHGVNAQWFDRMCADFAIEGVSPICDTSAQPKPWGWSPYAKRRLADEGFAESSLPTDKEIEVMRQLSHRRTSRRLALMLQDKLGWNVLARPAEEVFDDAELRKIVESFGSAYVKAPWSSSGRGVAATSEMSIDRLLKIGSDAIRRQGSVMVERAYDRAIDFAKLFRCADGRCECLGTSVFATDSHGAYVGNLLADEETRLKQIATHYDLCKLAEVTEALRQCIEQLIAPQYSGILGVDMLIDKNGLLDPVVEVNLRMTMGYVANRFAERYVARGSVGTYKVIAANTLSVASEYAIDEHRLTKGIVYLTPPNAHFAFVVEVDDKNR